MPVLLMFVYANIFRARILAEQSKGNALFDVADRTALITGGGSGIGAFMASALSDAGAKILVVGRRRDRLEAVLGQREGGIFSFDLGQNGAASRLAEAVAKAGFSPDVIVNAAGVNPRLHADSIDETGWLETVHLNLSVPFLVAQAFAPQMKSRGWGRIINIASLQSFRAFENGIAYGAAKGGIVQLTRAMAEAWSNHGITANAIAPGFFPTELTAPVFGNPEIAEKHAAQTAIGRNGELEDLRGPLLFLASDASAYVTGQTLAVDGGYTAR
jgi:NAD(P)-dependent dehydrogenase (short-subunit alcohol dehydrogenase family)